MEIKAYNPSYSSSWNEYVMTHSQATYCHLIGWRDIIKQTYGHTDCYFLAEDQSKIVGILPLFLIRSLIFGNSLISMPFLDYGGVLADDRETEKRLLLAAMGLGRRLKSGTLELRHIESRPFIEEIVNNMKNGPLDPNNQTKEAIYNTNSHKVRMLLRLPKDSASLMQSFKSKLRSQIMKPIKEGFEAMFGGLELLDDFYEVFSINMRDLGSPVHAKKLFKNLLHEFPKETRICVVSKGNKCVAASIVVGFRDVLENPWASSLHRYSRFSPNMLLYWTMLEYACNNGFSFFDFGRSSQGEGTFKFKKQWGAWENDLQWAYISLDNRKVIGGSSQKAKFQKAIDCWKKLPVSLTNIMGPMFRRYIGL
jgi:FemAB-related protein (PEP-CTERM system-associated)